MCRSLQYYSAWTFIGLLIHRISSCSLISSWIPQGMRRYLSNLRNFTVANFERAASRCAYLFMVKLLIVSWLSPWLMHTHTSTHMLLKFIWVRDSRHILMRHTHTHTHTHREAHMVLHLTAREPLNIIHRPLRVVNCWFLEYRLFFVGERIHCYIVHFALYNL